MTMLSSVVSAVLLMIGGAEQNPGPAAVGKVDMQVVCTGCGRNLGHAGGMYWMQQKS
jgi:hypothetical protein